MKRPNPFLHPLDLYQRDLDYMGHYISQSARYLSKVRNISYEEARAFVASELQPGGDHAFVDVPMTHTQRDEVAGDRYVRENTLHNYIREAVQARDVIAPTLTRYVSADIYKSPRSTFMVKNTTDRDVSKQKMFEQRVAGNEAGRVFYNNEQISKKTSNNSDSGAQMIASTALYNASGHPSLTSNCRITAAYGSTNNERIVSGMRHYYTPELALNNIISIIDNTDLVQTQKVMDHWNLHYPSAQDVFEMVERSSRHYWVSRNDALDIMELLERLSPIERAAVLYCGDLYHIRKHNDLFIRHLIDRLMLTDFEPHPDPDAIMKSADGDFINQAWMLQGRYAVDLAKEGKGLWDIKGTPEFGRVASTVANIYQVLEDYDDFIKTFMVSFNIPQGVVHFPDAIRECVLTGDTDSTIYTVQEWVKWYTGEYLLNELGIAVFTTLVFITCQTIVHTLAVLSANMGVSREHLLSNTMKNEYRFDYFVPTPVSKHYSSGTGAQEGRVFKEIEHDRKGVQLVTSAAPVSIMSRLGDMTARIGMAALSGQKIRITDEIRRIQTIEHEVLQSVKRGEHTYFRFNQIKTAESYKSTPDRSPFANYTMWQEVFAPKYGMCQPPPYSALKINTMINSPNSFKRWLESIEDQGLAHRFYEWCQRNNKTHVATFYLPEHVIQSIGIPEEIFSVMDKRRIVLDNTSSYYLALSTLGLPILEGGKDRLLIDYPFIPLTDA